MIKNDCVINQLLSLALRTTAVQSLSNGASSERIDVVRHSPAARVAFVEVRGHQEDLPRTDSQHQEHLQDVQPGLSACSPRRHCSQHAQGQSAVVSILLTLEVYFLGLDLGRDEH